MKLQIKKTLITVSALLLVFSGLAFAHGSDKRHHRHKGKANDHYKAEKRYSGWNNRHFKPWKHYRKYHWKRHFAGYYCKDGYYHYYDRKGRRWRIDHFKSRHHSRDRYGYKKRYRNHDNHYRRHVLREDVVYEVALKDPKIVFKVIKREHQ